LQVANAGSYTVIVSNDFGSVTSSVAIVDVVQPGVVIGTGTGLRGDYWASHAYTNGPVSSSPFLGAPTLTRTDATVNFSFGTGGPGSGVGSDLFTVRWSGQVQALDTDTYTFITTTDDGVRLWVNGQSIVDHWALQAPTDRSATIALTANTKYNILMEYFENGSGATAQLSWSTAGGGVPREIIPKSQLYPATGAAHPTLTGAVDNGTNIVFSWGPGTYNLQSSTVVTGVYTTVTGGIVSPFTITIDLPRRRSSIGCRFNKKTPGEITKDRASARSFAFCNNDGARTSVRSKLEMQRVWNRKWLVCKVMNCCGLKSALRSETELRSCKRVPRN
jgi:hypothetical protein